MGANFSISKAAKAALKKAESDRPKSNRKEDHRTEQIISDFLIDAYFKKKNETSKLVDTKELQFAGVDVQMEKNGHTSNIDIKAQASKKYINNPTKTFVLELDFLDKDGYRHIGWFLNEELITDYYTFVWVLDSDVDENNKLHTKDDIHKLEVMTIDKRKLSDYVMKRLKDVDYETIISEMRNTEETRRNLVNGIRFSHTPTLREKPVNLVVDKWVLKKFAICHSIVTKDEITKIK